MSLDRRDFLKLLGLAGGAVVAGKEALAKPLPEPVPAPKPKRPLPARKPHRGLRYPDEVTVRQERSVLRTSFGKTFGEFYPGSSDVTRLELAWVLEATDPALLDAARAHFESETPFEIEFGFGNSRRQLFEYRATYRVKVQLTGLTVATNPREALRLEAEAIAIGAVIVS